MVGRLKLAALTLVTAGLVFGQVASLQAQEAGARFRVLIPYFEPLEGADDDFGKDASKELRELINTLATHQPSFHEFIDKIGPGKGKLTGALQERDQKFGDYRTAKK